VGVTSATVTDLRQLEAHALRLGLGVSPTGLGLVHGRSSILNESKAHCHGPKMEVVKGRAGEGMCHTCYHLEAAQPGAQTLAERVMAADMQIAGMAEQGGSWKEGFCQQDWQLWAPEWALNNRSGCPSDWATPFPGPCLPTQGPRRFAF
jgi:hypothetical protein